MRETRNAQVSIFEDYSNHDYGIRFVRKLISANFTYAQAA